MPITIAAGEVRLEGAIEQSALVVGHAPTGTSVALDGRELRLAPDGRFLIGFGRDHAPEATLQVVHADGRREVRVLEVAARDYDIQRIDGLPSRMVRDFDEETLARILAERERIDAVKDRYTDQDGHREAFVWPAIGPISGIFGSQRILDGEPRAPHLGVDVAAPTGTPVAAMASGQVALADPDLFFTGGTVFIDHGQGLSSVYAHLSEVLVEEGQRVAKGEPIGAIGATGRVTGPHLHWGVYWLDQAIDPERLVGPMPGGSGGFSVCYGSASSLPGRC